MSAVDVVVLAAGDNRALTKIGNRTMLEYVVDALRASSCSRRIFVVGDVPLSDHYYCIAPQKTLLENVLLGLQATQDGEESKKVLLCTSDIPFITPASVDDFVIQSLTSGADFCYPIVPIDLCHKKFPEMKRTAAKVREGEFTGGNMALVNPADLIAHQTAIESAYAARKSPLQMGRLLGPTLLVRILLAQIAVPSLLPLAALEVGVGRVLGGCRAAAIITQYPEIGTDIDKPEDFIIARRLLS